MKKHFSIIALGLIATTFLIHLGCNKSSKNHLNSEYSYLPQDVIQTDTLKQDEFRGWFKSKIITENGIVIPANSLTSRFDKNFDFYKWSEQMFLWMTSQENGKHVIESPEFYTVSPINDGKRNFIPHKEGVLLRATSGLSKKGSNNLKVIKDKNGTPFEVEIHSENEKVLAKNDKNVLMAVHHAEANETGETLLKDNNNKLLSSRKLVFQSKLKSHKILHQFIINKKPVFLDSNGNVVDVELGQAGGDGVLMTKNNESLVYYITMCNDVFAYYLSGYKLNQIKDAQFPTTQAQLQEVLDYAKNNGWAAPKNPNALAIEIKTSWVEVTPDLPNPDSYIQIKAIVPVYDKSVSTQWTPKGERTATLAMVGMHVVGSVAGHPEMIWATFEHKKNTPNLGYAYRDVNNKIKQVAADTGTDWLFNRDASKTDSINFQNMTVKKIPNPKSTQKDTISVISFNSSKITSTRVKRIMAWGSASNTKPNNENETPADANSQVININNAVQNMLVGNDVRKNYLMIGATWTTGAAPNGSSYPYNSLTDSIPKIPTVAPSGDALGTAQVSNSTMETYMQSPNSASTYENQMSCFTCHSDYKKPSLNANKLSHVFVRLQPLPSGFALKKKK